MTKNNSGNFSTIRNADGGSFVIGILERLLSIIGGDVLLTGAGSETYTFPLVGGTLMTIESQVTPNTIAANKIIPAGYSFTAVNQIEISNTIYLEVENTAILEVS